MLILPSNDAVATYPGLRGQLAVLKDQLFVTGSCGEVSALARYNYALRTYFSNHLAG
jgi:hypothetical protein